MNKLVAENLQIIEKRFHFSKPRLLTEWFVFYYTIDLFNFSQPRYPNILLIKLKNLNEMFSDEIEIVMTVGVDFNDKTRFFCNYHRKNVENFT